MKEQETVEVVDETTKLPYEHCLNCGTELKGLYCHSCGQEAVNKTPTIWGFVLEYLNNAFIWDTKFLTTFWTMISRPGKLTKEYNEGRFVSQEHPLKLNMFLLFVFITLFVFFSSAEKMTSSVHTITNDERVVSSVQINMLIEDEEYAAKIQESPRDTLLLEAPLPIADDYPTIISNIETYEDAQDDSLDRWLAVVPHVLVEDNIIVKGDSGYYSFNTEKEGGQDVVDMVNSVWSEMVRIVSQYFPMLLLLTVPFLTFSLRVVQRKSKVPKVHHFVFALHYTAFMETIMILIFILYLAFEPSMGILQYGMMLSSWVYLGIAYHRVYATTWYGAVIKSLLTSVIYFAILLLILTLIFITSVIMIILETV